MPDLLYPGHYRCSGAVYHFGGAPGPCGAEPKMTVRHEYRYPRRHVARLFCCAEHGEGEPDPRSLTDADRAELMRRRDEYTKAIALRDANRAKVRRAEGN